MSHVAEEAEADAEFEGDQHREGVLWIAEQRVDDSGPALIEVNQRRHLVHDLYRRRQPGLDGVLDEDPLGEGVEGAQRSPVEFHERPAGGLGLGTLPGGHRLEAATDPVTEFGGRPVGERNGGDVLHGHARDHEGHDAVDEGAGLAGSGTGLDEQGRLEVADDAVTRRLVDGHGRLRHRSLRGR